MDFSPLQTCHQIAELCVGVRLSTLLPQSCGRRSTGSPQIQQLRLGLQEKEATRDGSSATPDRDVLAGKHRPAKTHGMSRGNRALSSFDWPATRSRRHRGRAVQKSYGVTQGSASGGTRCGHLWVPSPVTHLVGSSTTLDLAQALASEQRPRRRRLEESIGSNCPCIDDEALGLPLLGNKEKPQECCHIQHEVHRARPPTHCRLLCWKTGSTQSPAGPKICRLLHLRLTDEENSADMRPNTHVQSC